MKLILSENNAFVIRLSKLKDKKYRREAHMYLVEGAKMVREALELNQDVKCIALLNSELNRYAEILSLAKEHVEVIALPENVFRKLCDTESPQGILAAVAYREREILPPKGNSLILDRISDPGNLGTIIRTANACGYRELYLVGCVEPYNPKVVRSTMSGIYSVVLYECTEAQAIVATSGILRICADMNGENLFERQPIGRHCIVIGSESHGVSPSLRSACRKVFSLPMRPGAESLNAAMAAGIFMYELEYGKATVNRR